VHAEDVRFARAHTDRQLKFALPGPMTIVETVANDYYRDEAELADAFARVLNEEARELARLGVDLIQLDEPAFNIHLDKVKSWGIAALERSIQGLPCKTAVHICYGYGLEANIAWKHGLGAEWRQYEQIFPLLARSAIDQVSLEYAASRVPGSLLGLLAGKDVQVGAIDIATLSIETPEQVRETLRKALEYVPIGHLCPSTNCGLALLPREVARAKLRALVAGTAQLRRELG
jgi:5-methyltetrahydropteroyltriglutamate--homocysteine methyltransferase